MIGLYFHRVAVPAFNVRGFQIFKSKPTYNYQLLKLTTKHSRFPYHKIVVGDYQLKNDKIFGAENQTYR